jgi:hypothetical protein
MIQIRSDFSGALIPEGAHNAGREPVEYEMGGIRVRLEVLTPEKDLTPTDVRRIVLEGIQLPPVSPALVARHELFAGGRIS